MEVLMIRKDLLHQYLDDSLVQHLVTTTEEAINKLNFSHQFSCNDCNFETTKITSLKMHNLTHRINQTPRKQISFSGVTEVVGSTPEAKKDACQLKANTNVLRNISNTYMHEKNFNADSPKKDLSSKENENGYNHLAEYDLINSEISMNDDTTVTAESHIDADRVENEKNLNADLTEKDADSEVIENGYNHHTEDDLTSSEPNSNDDITLSTESHIDADRVENEKNLYADVPEKDSNSKVIENGYNQHAADDLTSSESRLNDDMTVPAQSQIDAVRIDEINLNANVSTKDANSTVIENGYNQNAENDLTSSESILNDERTVPVQSQFCNNEMDNEKSLNADLSEKLTNAKTIEDDDNNHVVDDLADSEPSMNDDITVTAQSHINADRVENDNNMNVDSPEKDTNCKAIENGYNHHAEDELTNSESGLNDEITVPVQSHNYNDETGNEQSLNADLPEKSSYSKTIEDGYNHREEDDLTNSEASLNDVTVSEQSHIDSDTVENKNNADKAESSLNAESENDDESDSDLDSDESESDSDTDESDDDSDPDFTIDESDCDSSDEEEDMKYNMQCEGCSKKIYVKNPASADGYKCPDCCGDVQVITSMMKRTNISAKKDVSKVHQCDKCLQYFSSEASVNLHKLYCSKDPNSPYVSADTPSNTSNTPSNPHQCELCHKSYKRLGALKNHMKLHENDVGVAEVKSAAIPFSLEELNTCLTPTKKTDSLTIIPKKVLVITEDEDSYVNTFQCEYCNKSYTSKGYLLRHIKTMHSVSQNVIVT